MNNIKQEVKVVRNRSDLNGVLFGEKILVIEERDGKAGLNREEGRFGAIDYNCLWHSEELLLVKEIFPTGIVIRKYQFTKSGIEWYDWESIKITNSNQTLLKYSRYPAIKKIMMEAQII